VDTVNKLVCEDSPKSQSKSYEICSRSRETVLQNQILKDLMLTGLN
jgi:hypothetical protein